MEPQNVVLTGFTFTLLFHRNIFQNGFSSMIKTTYGTVLEVVGTLLDGPTSFLILFKARARTRLLSLIVTENLIAEF